MGIMSCDWCNKNVVHVDPSLKVDNTTFPNPTTTQPTANYADPLGTNLNNYKVMVMALYDFNAPEPADLSFKAGDILLLEDNKGQDWSLAFNPRTSSTGNIPMNYVATESDSVACQAWYNINRTEAERKLFIPGVENGMFILRPSSANYCLALSVKYSNADRCDIKHYKVNFPPTEGKFYIRPNFRADTLDELLIFYMTTPLDIGGCLLMPRPKVVPPPFNFQEFAIDRSIIKLTDRLGSGNFGEVWLAKMQTVTVAVKTCLPTATKEDFVNEAQTMFILNHPRLVRFLGYCNRPADEPFYLITEYMENGSLKDFLIKNQKRITYEKCIQIIHQVAVAMAFLEEVNIVHRDLRAANVLVDKDENVKVADFGLTRILRDTPSDNSENYAFPVRWTPPEAMVRGYQPSSTADVWSFGVLAYEVLTYGKTPYEDLDKEAIKDFLNSGKRLANPQSCGFRCSAGLYQLMCSCWKLDPNERPAFKQIEIKLEQEILESNGQMYDADLNERRED